MSLISVSEYLLMKCSFLLFSTKRCFNNLFCKELLNEYESLLKSLSYAGRQHLFYKMPFFCLVMFEINSGNLQKEDIIFQNEPIRF
jgi:hypothetical protein